jgi:hypothetical protein
VHRPVGAVDLEVRGRAALAVGIFHPIGEASPRSVQVIGPAREAIGQRQQVGDLQAGVVRLPIAGQVVQSRRAAGAEREVLGEVVVVAVRVLVARLAVRRMRPGAALDEVQPGIVGLMVDIDVPSVLVGGREQALPAGSSVRAYCCAMR